MLLSIVIPVYNVEKYIERCLRSCANQNISVSDYEIIVVNDGPTDSSASVVANVAKEYRNIKIVSQLNQGLSVARNNGLKVAQGDYVWFVDSDDWIEPDCLRRITSLLVDKLDILQLQYRLAYDNVELNLEKDPLLIDGIVSGKKVFLNGGLPAPAQFCIYRRAFLQDNHLKFVPGILHEDSEFKPRATFLAERISSDSLVSYNYYQRHNGSIMSSFTMKRARDIFFVCNNLYQFASGLEKIYQRHFYNHISLNLNSLFYETRKLSKQSQKEVYHLLDNNRHLLSCMRKSTNLKYKIEGMFFGISISWGFKLHKLMR